ncbi:hypothetical protein ACFYZ5_35325 [Streptomyces chartreusis]|uniref:hypothetical protein n=1 Tax=Streptomyces chartreusis TaxID=1969 RepID=UPI003675B97C
MPQDLPMQSELIVGVVGLAGTVVGAGLGVLGAVLAAQLTGRAQVDGQVAQTRRESFHACAQAFIARQAALNEYLSLLYEVSSHPEELRPDPSTGRVQWQSYCQQKAELKRLNIEALQALGGVAVAGTPHVWRHAAFASGLAEMAYERLEGWFRFLREDGSWSGGPVDRITYTEFARMINQHNRELHIFLDACNETLSPKPRRRLRKVQRVPAISPLRWVIAP